MKELAANEMEVWKYDVKRNAQVRKGRISQEEARKERERSISDLDLDLLAPYLEKYSGADSLTKSQALAVIHRFDQTSFWTCPPFS